MIKTLNLKTVNRYLQKLYAFRGVSAECGKNDIHRAKCIFKAFEESKTSLKTCILLKYSYKDDLI